MSDNTFELNGHILEIIEIEERPTAVLKDDQLEWRPVKMDVNCPNLEVIKEMSAMAMSGDTCNGILRMKSSRFNAIDIYELIALKLNGVYWETDQEQPNYTLDLSFCDCEYEFKKTRKSNHWIKRKNEKSLGRKKQ